MAVALLIAASGAVIACTEPATAPPSASSRANLSSNFGASDPANGVVYRYNEDVAVCWTDQGNGLRVCQRTEQFPSGDCGVFEPIGGVSRQDVVTLTDPADFFATQIKVNERGKVWITVRDLTQPGACYGAARVAEGWGTLHYTDNDYIGTDGANHNSNASTFRGEGTLTAIDGRTVRYDGHTHIVFNPDRGPVTFQAEVNVH
jgi:hypothetical protein